MKQIKASVVSNARREWIEALTNDVAEYAALMRRASVILSTISGRLTSAPDELRETQKDLDKALPIGVRIHLRLVVLKEQDCDKVVEVMQAIEEQGAKLTQAAKAGQDWGIPYKNLQGLIGQFISVSLSILKQEWKKVRRGE